MTKEELRQEAEAEADKVIIGSGMDRTSVIHLKHLLVTMYIQGATKVTKELEAQIEKMSEILLDLLWLEEHLDSYMYECNDAQKGELLKPFDNARLFLEKYKCKKCKGEGTIKVGYNEWTTNPCPACEGKGYILRR